MEGSDWIESEECIVLWGSDLVKERRCGVGYDTKGEGSDKEVKTGRY